MTNTKPIILSHESALAVWRSPDIVVGRALDTREAQRVLLETRSSLRVRSLREVTGLSALADIPLPYDLLTSKRGDRRITSRARMWCVQTALPENALYEVDGTEGRVVVSSPELCFVQMANRLTFYNLVFLGYELCGSYVIRPQDLRGYIKTDPVSSPEKLLAFAQHAYNMTGAKSARKASKWLIEGARSPKEAAICMLAHLPRSQGGMGTQAPLLGQALEAPDPAARILGARYFTPALYWSGARTVVEFNTRDWATPEERVNYDKLVRNAYRIMGISAISLGKDDLTDPDGLRKHFDFINRKCKKRLQPPNDHQLMRQDEFLKWTIIDSEIH